MRRHSFHFRLALLSLLSSTLLTACTLMDNDLRGLPETPGFKEVVHVENDEGTIDYQYNPNTKVLDESYLGYIASMDYDNKTLYLYDYIPEDLRPEVGDVLAAVRSEKLEWGLSHNVRAVKKEGNLYAVAIEKATLDEVFKTLKVDCETNFVLDYPEEDEESGAASTRSETRSGWRKVGRFEANMMRTRADDEIDEAAKNDPNHSKWQHGKSFKPISIDILKKLMGLGLKGLIFDSAIESLTGVDTSVHTISGSASTGNGEGALSAQFDLTAQLKATITPIVKVRNYIYITDEEKKFDVFLNIGANFELKTLLAGSFALKFDLWKYFDLPNLPPVSLAAAVAGLPLYYSSEFSLVLDATFSGSMGYTWTKDFDMTIGACYNIPGKENGVYSEKYNPDLRRNEEAGWKMESENSLSFSAGLTFSVAPNLFFGAPSDAPRLGLKYAPSVGLRFKIGATSDKTTKDEATINVSVPIRFADIYAYLVFWKNFELSYNIGDAIVKAIGGKDAEAEVKLWERTWRFYPSIDDVILLCTNFDKTNETPKFKLDFDAKEMGIKATSEKNLRPRVIIYDADGNEITRKTDFDYCDKYDAGKHFTWTFSSSKIKRDKKYTAQIHWMKKSHLGENRMYHKVLEFTTHSPSCYIASHTITAQRVRYKELTKDSYKNGVAAYPYTPNKRTCKGYQYDFNLLVSINNYKDIDEWGFYIGSNKKKYKITKRPQYPAAFVYFKSSEKKWSTKSDKHYTVRTWVKSGQTINEWPEPYSLKLSYDASKNDPKYSGKKDKEGYDIPYVHDSSNYFVYGFQQYRDNSIDFYYDVDTKIPLAAREKTNNDEAWNSDNIPVYVIDLDELDDDLEEE